jgi:hypothetical protein
MNGCQSVPPTPCPWIISHRADQKARRVADRHYTRQKVGTPQFVPPGRCIVLRTPNEDAYWVSSWPFPRYVKHAWAGAWTCSAFRNESPQSYLSSDMIRHAVGMRTIVRMRTTNGRRLRPRSSPRQAACSRPAEGPTSSHGAGRAVAARTDRNNSRPRNGTRPRPDRRNARMLSPRNLHNANDRSHGSDRTRELESAVARIDRCIGRGRIGIWIRTNLRVGRIGLGCQNLCDLSQVRGPVLPVALMVRVNPMAITNVIRRPARTGPNHGTV